MASFMAIGAHPDDIELGMGATVHKLIREGHAVVCVDLTDGEPTPHGTRELRAQETAAANERLGITERVCLELPNRVLADTEEARRRLAALMREHRPAAVFTHVAHDVHPDHVAAAAITRGAVLLSRIVKIDLPHEPFRPGPVYHFLWSHLRHLHQPDFVLSVEEEDAQAKVAAVRAYASQFLANPANVDIVDWVRRRLDTDGALGRVPQGEGFQAEEPPCLADLTALVQVRQER